jgi:hypothetical protein
MVTVGIVAVLLAAERFLFDCAVELVKSHDEYLRDEAVTVWAILNIPLSLLVWMTTAFVRAAGRDWAEAQKRIG